MNKRVLCQNNFGITLYFINVRTFTKSKYNDLEQSNINFLILTNNEFFRLVNDGTDSCTTTASAYNEFIKEVCVVCCTSLSEQHHLVFTLSLISGIRLGTQCLYNAYTDIKRRKSESRTYFLDKLRECLNLRMQRDDEKEQKRRR